MDKIRSMSELEMVSFIQELTEHIHKNNMSHLLESDRVSDLEEQLEDAERELNSLENERDELVDRIDLIHDALGDFDTTDNEDDMQKAIDKILSI